MEVPKLSEISHETPITDQASPLTFMDLILALDEVLKTRTEHMHDMETAFQTNIVYSDHRWKS